MFKLFVLIALQGMVIGVDRWEFHALVVLLAVGVSFWKKKLMQPILLGVYFFASFLGFLFFLQMVESWLFHSAYDVKPAIRVTTKGFTSFALFAVWSRLMTRLEFLNSMRRLHFPALMISVIYFISYFLKRLSSHAKELRKAYCLKAINCGWVQKVRLLLSTTQNFMVFAFIRSRDIPKVMELRGMTGELPIQEWRQRETNR